MAQNWDLLSENSICEFNAPKDFQSLLESSIPSSSPVENKGRWSKEEHNRFVSVLLKAEADWKLISRELEPGRSMAQIKSHAQKFYRTYKKRMEKYQTLIETDRDNLSEKTKIFLVQELLSCSDSCAEKALSELEFTKIIENMNKYSGLRAESLSTTHKIIVVNFTDTAVAMDLVKKKVLDNFPEIDLSKATFLTIKSDPEKSA